MKIGRTIVKNGVRMRSGTTPGGRPYTATMSKGPRGQKRSQITVNSPSKRGVRMPPGTGDTGIKSPTGAVTKTRMGSSVKKFTTPGIQKIGNRTNTVIPAKHIKRGPTTPSSRTIKFGRSARSFGMPKQVQMPYERNRGARTGGVVGGSLRKP